MLNILQQSQAKAIRRTTERIHLATSAALVMLSWLEAEGFDVLGLSIEPERKPIVNIALSSKCQWLKTKHRAYVHRIDGGVHARTWRADIMGCRVQWIEGGN